MSKFRIDVKSGNSEFEPGSEPTAEETQKVSGDITAEVATIGVVAVGAAIFSAELIPGMILGVAAAAKVPPQDARWSAAAIQLRSPRGI
jgi:hypothetical protein